MTASLFIFSRTKIPANALPYRLMTSSIRTLFDGATERIRPSNIKHANIHISSYRSLVKSSPGIRDEFHKAIHQKQMLIEYVNNYIKLGFIFPSVSLDHLSFVKEMR
jgi:hypothetical protein